MVLNRQIERGNLWRGRTGSWPDTPVMFLSPLIFVVICAMFEPEVIVQGHPSLHKLIHLGSYVGALMGFVCLFKCKKLPSTVFLISGLCLTGIISAVFSDYAQSVDALDQCLQHIRLMLTSLLFFYWLTCCPRKLARIASAYFFVLVILNLIIELARPGGLYTAAWTHEPCFLFGHKNTSILGFLPGFVFVFLNDYLNCGRLSVLSFAYWCLAVLNVTLARSSTSLAAVFIASVLLLFVLASGRIRICPSLLLIPGFLLSALLLFNTIPGFFSNLIMSLFGKTVTFSGRTFIWAKTLSLLDSNLLFGIGSLPSELMRRLVGGVNAHSFLLGIIASGGLLRLLVYLLWVFCSAVAYRCSQKSLYECAPLVFGFTCLAIVGLMENIDLTWCLLFYCVSLDVYCCDQ